VLLLGETGTGKELCAHIIHSYSQRANGPFFAINLATLTPPLAASELFGHEKGAFTDAVTQKEGVFQAADSGTLFLDEITEASIAVQPCLLRAIEACEIRLVGASSEVATNVRIIAASNQEIKTALSEGRLRSDLYFRLAGIEIQLPPL